MTVLWRIVLFGFAALFAVQVGVVMAALWVAESKRADPEEFMIAAAKAGFTREQALFLRFGTKSGPAR